MAYIPGFDIQNVDRIISKVGLYNVKMTFSMAFAGQNYPKLKGHFHYRLVNSTLVYQNNQNDLSMHQL